MAFNMSVPHRGVEMLLSMLLMRAEDWVLNMEAAGRTIRPEMRDQI